MIKLRIKNPDITQNEKTYFSAPISAGVTILPVKNTEGYSTNDYVVLGKVGREKAEQGLISTIDTDTQITLSVGLKFPHSTDEEITYTDFNQVQIYMATSSGGTYTLQTTVDIEWDDEETEWADTDGETTYYYKWRYYNSVSAISSDYSDPIPGSDWAYDTIATISDEVLREAQDEDETVTDRSEILSWTRDCERDIKSRAGRKRLSDLRTRAYLIPVADSYSVDLPNNFDYRDFLRYHYDNDADGTVEQIYRLRYIPPIEWEYKTENAEASSSDDLQLYTIDELNQVVKLHPTPATDGDQSAGSFLVMGYYKDLPTLDSDGDTITFPRPAIYKNYCLWRINLKKGREFWNLANMFKGEYERGVVAYLSSQREETSKPKGFKYYPDRERRWYKY